MNTFMVITLSIVTLFILGEAYAAYRILKNPAFFIARLRRLLGTDEVSYKLSQIQEDQARIERKINYIGRHTKFEREQLRAMGLLKDESPSSDSTSVIPLRRN